MKKPSLIIGKKQIILSCLTLMLATAVYVNYAVTKDSTNTVPMTAADAVTHEDADEIYGDTEFVNAGSPQASAEKSEKSDSSAKAENQEGGIPTEKAEDVSTAEYFAQARLERTAARDEAVSAMQSVLGAGDRTDDELVTDAVAAVETSKLIESESNIESIVKSMGYPDCIVYLDKGSAKVVVQTEGLDAAGAAAIKDVILGEVSIPAENIRLFEVK